MTTPVSNGAGLSGNPLIDGLVQGGVWQFSGPTHLLSYSFSVNDEPGSPVVPATLALAVTRALQAWSDVADITFQEQGSGTVITSSPADLAIIYLGDPYVPLRGLGIFPDPAFGDVVLDTDYTRATYPQPEGDIVYNLSASFTPGTYGYEVVLHEIGHALGLKHPYDDGANGRPTFSALGITEYDSTRYTVMSASESGSLGFESRAAAAPMPLDILAIQRLYGANMSYHAGDDAYALAPGGLFTTIWDAGGNDTLDASAQQLSTFEGNVIDLRAGHFSHLVNPVVSLPDFLLGIAYGVTIENAKGSRANDVIWGNDAANMIDGGAGADRMSGGKGDDTYIVDNTNDAIVESEGEGTDWVRSDVTYTLPANVENLQLLDILGLQPNATGNPLANIIRGNNGANSIAGGAGDDTLDGMAGNDAIDGGDGNDTLQGGAGIDTLQGGAGDDVYLIDDEQRLGPTSLLVSGDPGEYISAGKTLAFNPDTAVFSVRNILTNVNGEVSAVSLAVTDITLGGSHFWSLNFGVTSVPGASLAVGTYSDARPTGISGYPWIDVAGDGRGGSAGGSFTILEAQFDYSGASPVLQRFAVTFDQASTSSSSAPKLHGAFNFNATSAPASLLDTVTEASDGGLDTVKSAFSYVLPANVENLTLTGTADVNGTGNALDNMLTGNSGNNTLTGGLGNDTYVIQSAGDVIVEGANAGNDTVVTPFSYAVAGTNLENVTLSGTSDIDATGDAGNNVLVGNAGANVLTGGAGDDTYEIQNAGDRVVELAGEGNDTVRTTLGYDVAGTNVENVTLIGTGLVDATGDALANVLRGNGAANLLRGLGGNDTLNGDAGNDTLSGGAGDDTLIGGVGRDVAVYSGARGDYALTRANGTVTVTSAAEGTDTLSSVERIDFGDGSFVKLGGGAGSDFDGDGRMDMLWRNVDGTPAIWQMDGLSTGPIGPINGGVVVPNDWKILGTGDYDADGRTDILWRNDDGMPAIWLMDGMTTLSASPVNGGVVVPNEWKFAANADFNADGYTDILWRNDQGMPAIWQMDGVNTRVANPINGGVAVPTDWKIAGTGDFNGDGNADILWRNDDGTPAIWTMDGVNTLAADVINGGVRVPNDWKIAGVGDFDGDAKSDILWRNVDGTPSIWLMDGYSTATANVINGGAVVPNAWKVINVADYNGDGRDDILWRHADGTPAMWLMNGVTTDAANAINGGVQVPNDWVIV